MHRFIFVLAVFFMTTCVFSQSDKADSLFAPLAGEKPGVSVAMVKDGKMVFLKSYGIANLEYGIPVSDTTPFHAASLSKQFTAFCILLLQEKGLLSMNDEIRRYIPELPDYGYPITLLQLATHTSGLREQWRLLEMAGWRLDDVIRKQQILSLAFRQRGLNFIPGEKFMYCNTGYTLLAEVVERVSGMNLSRYAQQNIFGPLGMTHTFFNDDYERIVKNRAYSYHKEREGYKKSVLNYSVTGATSLFTTAADLGKWAVFLNAPGEAYKNVVKALNTPPTMHNGSQQENAPGQFTGVKFHGLEWFDHSGSDAGFRSYLGRFPEHNAAVVVLSNSIPSDANAMALSLADLFLKEYYVDKPKLPAKPVFEHDATKFIQLDRQSLAAFTGTYWQPGEWYNRIIQLVGDTLVYMRPGGASSKLAAIAPNEFKMLGDREDVSVVFTKSDAGTPVMQMIINNRKPLLFEKFTETNLLSYAGDFYSDELQSNFQISVKNGKLVASHLRLDDFELIPVNASFLTSANRNFRKIEVLRNRDGQITGLRVDNDGVSGIVFQKK